MKNRPVTNEPKHFHLSPDIPEHDGEPVPGLPERLPAGETLLWQGRPAAPGMARRAMGLRGLSLYFGALLVLQAGWGLAQGVAGVQLIGGLVISVVIGLVCLGVLLVIGRFAASTTLYTVTDRRVVMRVGIALPMTINIPFTVIEGVARSTHADGTEDVMLSILKPARLSWMVLWPHVRLGSILHPQPVLRAVPQGQGVAQLLARALAASAGMPVQPMASTAQPVPRPGAAAMTA